jgi:hypothetical protein
MSQKEIQQIKQEVKEKALAKMRYQWFVEYRQCKNAKQVCRKYGISRSRFYYWKKRLDVLSSGKGKGYAKAMETSFLFATSPNEPESIFV